MDQDEAIVHFYPKTNIRMVPGDILYSHKYALSSFLVGHTAIVGKNFRIYHVNRWEPFGHADSMPIYLSRHKKGEKLTILRYDYRLEAEQAAEWAMLNINRVKRYRYFRDLQGITNNYCSKFIWQAYYFGTKGRADLFPSRNKKYKGYIMPGLFPRNLRVISRFANTLYDS